MFTCPIPAPAELLVPGTAGLRPAGTPGRRTAFSLVMTQDKEEWVSLDTGVPNRVVRRALERGELPELSGYATVQPGVHLWAQPAGLSAGGSERALPA